LAEYAQHMFNL
jgi:hypothetical protein